MIKPMQTGPDMVHTKSGVMEDAAERFLPLTEDATNGEAEGENIASTREDRGVPRQKRTGIIYMVGASKHVDEVESLIGNNDRSIQRLQYHNANTFKEAMNTGCSCMIVLIEEQFSELLEDEYKICKDVLKDLVEAEKDVRLISCSDDDETNQEVKYKLPKALRKRIVHHTQIRRSASGCVTLEDHPTTVAQVGNNNHIEVKPGADRTDTLQVGKRNTFSTSSDHPTTAAQVDNNNHIEVKQGADSIHTLQVGERNTLATSNDHPTTAAQVGNNNHTCIEVKPGADSIDTLQVGKMNTFSTSSDHPTTAAQVGNNNHIEVKPGAGSTDTLQVGRSNTLSILSGPSIQGYKLKITTPEADHELYAEIKRDIDSNIDDINISLKPLNTWIESTGLGSVIISVKVQPGTKLGPLWLREVITKILSEDIFAKLPNGTRMGINISASVPLTPLDVDIFELKDEKWITDYTSDSTRKDDTGRSMLHQAAILGNRSAVILSLKSGCIIDDQDKHGNTALHYAVVLEENSAAVSRLLIEGGASIEIVNRYGYTPLHRAVAKENLEILELIAERFGVKDSNPTSSNPSDISHLTELMIRQGADVNALNKDKYTPLQVAASSQSFDVIAVLLTEGADANVVYINGQTPLHRVYGSFTASTQRYRLNETSRRRRRSHVGPRTEDKADNDVAPSSPFDIPDSEGNTPLHGALKANLIQGAIALVKAGASVNTKNNVADTPLHTLARNKNMETTNSENDAVIKLIECSRDVNVKDKRGNTPLMAAVEYDKDISTLLTAGAEVNAKNSLGDTALMTAAERGCKENVSAILKCGADVNASNTHGETAFHKVAKHNMSRNTTSDMKRNIAEIVEILLKAGADINAKDHMGNTPLMTATEEIRHREGERILFPLLIAGGANVNAQDVNGNTPLMVAVTAGLDISPLLRAGADVNSKNKSGKSALHLVFENYRVFSHFEERSLSVSQLIAKGADVSPEDDDCNTPLMMAGTARRGISSFLTCLVDVKSKNKSSKTARHHIYWSKERSNSYVSQLIAAGADVNAQDDDGNTPLMMAVKAGHDISELLTAGADVNSKNQSGKTTLHLVSKGCYLPDINSVYSGRYSGRGNNYALQLINAGADVNAQDDDGNTPLHFCVQKCNYSDAMVLLRNPLSAVNIVNKYGQSVLSLVVDADESLPSSSNFILENYRYLQESEETEVIRAILNKNPDRQIENKTGGDPLHTAEVTTARETAQLRVLTSVYWSSERGDKNAEKAQPTGE